MSTPFPPKTIPPMLLTVPEKPLRRKIISPAPQAIMETVGVRENYQDTMEIPDTTPRVMQIQTAWQNPSATGRMPNGNPTQMDYAQARKRRRGSPPHAIDVTEEEGQQGMGGLQAEASFAAVDLDGMDVAASAKEDARATRPRNWNDVLSLQTALNPSILHFTLLTQRTPNMPSPWGSYNEQRADLQRQLNLLLGKKNENLKENQLVRLEKWTGGIPNANIATKLRQKTYVDEFNHREPSKTQLIPGTLLWAERYEAPTLFEKTSDLLERANEKLRTGRMDEIEREDAYTAVLLNADEFLFYLCTIGFQQYANVKADQSWDRWCKGDAPIEFGVLHNVAQERMKGKEISFAACRSRFRQPSLSFPVITFEQAERAHQRWVQEGRPHWQPSRARSLSAIRGHDCFMGFPRPR